MQRIKNGKRVSLTFDNWAEWVNYCEGAETCENAAALPRHSIDYGGMDKFAGATVTQAIEFARYGWRKGAEKVERLSSRISHAVGSKMITHVPHFAVAGACFDPGRFCAGDPDCMMDFGTEYRDAPNGNILRLSVSIACSSYVPNNSITLFGASIVALIDSIEMSGRSVELHLGVTMVYWEFSTLLKSAGEPLDIDRLAFAIAHPASQRKLLFMAQEREPSAVRKKCGFDGGGYHGGRPYDPDCKPSIGSDIPLPSINQFHEAVQNEGDAVKWILGKLREAGVEVEA